MTRVLAFDIGVCNFAYCIADINSNGEPPVIVKCANSRIGNAKDPIAILITNMAEFLHTHKSILQDDIHSVIIEQQVALKASKNQSLSAALYMYYANLIATQHPTLTEVRFVNPRAKFKKIAELPYEVLDPYRTQLKEARGSSLKKLSVDVVKILLVHWKCFAAYETVCSAKKADDLADSLLYSCLC